MIKTKVLKLNTNVETEVLTAERDTKIAALSIVYLNTQSSKTVNLYLKPTTSSITKGALLYRTPLTSTGIHIGNLYLAEGNQLTIEVPDLNPAEGDIVDVVIQYIEF
jgi:hypothetical protein